MVQGSCIICRPGTLNKGAPPCQQLKPIPSGLLPLRLGAFLLCKIRAFRSNPADFRFNRLRGTGALPPNPRREAERPPGPPTIKVNAVALRINGGKVDRFRGQL
jgi:hypothetical protein